MNYLALVNRMRRECGVSGAALTTIVGATGESQRCAEWVQQAWIEMQEEHEDWAWLRKTVSFQTVQGTQLYTTTTVSATDHASWIPSSFRCYLTSAGYANEMHLTSMDYVSFRDTYIFNAFRTTQSRPISISATPGDNSLLLGPVPNDTYTVVGEYFKTPIELSADADIPEMPTRFHMAIVYKAMMHYGMYEAAPEVYQRGETRYKDMLNNLEVSQLLAFDIGGAMA